MIRTTRKLTDIDFSKLCILEGLANAKVEEVIGGFIGKDDTYTITYMKQEGAEVYDLTLKKNGTPTDFSNHVAILKFLDRNKRMRNILGLDILHSHPMKQRELAELCLQSGDDKFWAEHVIVDRKDWEQVVSNQQPYAVVPIDFPTVSNPFNYAQDEYARRSQTIRNRKGTVRLDRSLMLDASHHELMLIYANILPVFMRLEEEFTANRDTIVLHAVSIHFDEVAEGEKVPEYDFQFTRGSDGFVAMTKVRRKTPLPY